MHKVVTALSWGVLSCCTLTSSLLSQRPTARADAPSQVVDAIYARAFAGIVVDRLRQDSARAVIGRSTAQMFAYNGAVPTDSVKAAIFAVLDRRDALLLNLMRDSISRRQLLMNLRQMR
jgi:hypothetical protein